MDHPDVLIIGGGSAGAVLASRLSEDPATRVMLVEAGRDTPPGAVPADIADTFPSSSLNASYFWPGLQAQRSSDMPLRPYVQARVMGGGSSVMGLWALRGMPSDYDAWAAAGATGWSWSDVLPVFRRLENDADRDQSQASVGSYPIRRLPREEWPGLVLAVEGEAWRKGLRFVNDMNETPSEGFFAMPLSQDAQGRASSARCYLTPEVRRRNNLAIATETTVTAIRFDGRRACHTLLNQFPGITGIAANDMIALGCYEALRERGLICPRDVSVTGYNDSPFVDLLTPPLTTVRIPQREIGLEAVRLLLQKIDEQHARVKDVVLRPQLIVRQSTAAPRVGILLSTSSKRR